jgi:hypothetical protein
VTSFLRRQYSSQLLPWKHQSSLALIFIKDNRDLLLSEVYQHNFFILKHPLA